MSRSDSPTRRLRVLLVDDDVPLRNTMQSMLRLAGHEIQVAGNGRAALHLAERHRFDAVVVDFQMPGMNGVEVLQAMRELRPTCARLLLTGQLNIEVVIDAINRGEVTRALAKPVPVNELLTSLDDACRARRRLMEAVHADDEAHRQLERQVRAAELATCIASDELYLALQPIVRSTDFRAVAFEALLRCDGDAFAGPAEILAAAEACDMLGELGSAVAQRAAGVIERLPEDARLFVNLHPAELANPDAAVRRLMVLQPWADRVVLEITERSSLTGIDAWDASVHELTAMGFALALDDLGAGYSSLAILAELRPEFLKVDMSIIRDVHRSPRRQRLLDLLCRFADATGASLVAEGVETAEEAEAIRLLNAHIMQGYLFGKPAAELPEHADPLFAPCEATAD